MTESLADYVTRLEQLKNKYYQQTLDDEITISDLITKCKELRKANEISIKNVTVTAEAKRLQELEQENKELKAEIRLYNCIEKWGTTQCRCACRCLGNEFCEDADKKINAYRSALEEIRIMATKDVSIESFVKIQTRINEVLK